MLRTDNAEVECGGGSVNDNQPKPASSLTDRYYCNLRTPEAFSFPQCEKAGICSPTLEKDAQMAHRL